MRVEEFTMLVQEHARAWEKAGGSNSSYVYDPNARYELQEARDMSKQLIYAFRGALNRGINNGGK